MEINNQFQLDKLKNLIERNKILQAKLEIAEAALEFYSNPWNWGTHKTSDGETYSPIKDFGITKASEALAKMKEIK